MQTNNILKILRQPKIFDISIFDVIATYVTTYIIKNYTIWFQNMSILTLFINFMFFAICFHYFMGVPTMLNYYLGLNTRQSVIDKR